MHKPSRGLLCLAFASACGVAGASGQVVGPCPLAARAQGMQAAIDPATGRLRAPTATERQALAAPSSAAGAPSARRPRDEAEAQRTLRRGPRGMSMQLPDSRFNTSGTAAAPGGCPQGAPAADAEGDRTSSR